MGPTVTDKIINQHLKEGTTSELEPGTEIELEVDQTLTQDATGVLVYLEFEKFAVDSIQTDLSVSYVDHNTLQTSFRNAEDHAYLRSAAAKFGAYYSRPGNGICHQIHLERFAAPGKTLVGSDSHTPNAGGVGSLAIGAGGLDVATVMAGEPISIKYPRVTGIQLTGKLTGWVSAKDVILHVLKLIGVQGGVNRIFEYFGPGVTQLDVPSRATITNMGAETGATSSLFPSDKITKGWLKAQGRESDWVELSADSKSAYEEIIEVDLSRIEPLVALPHSPGNVERVKDHKGLRFEQVAVGSCTNSSLKDLKTVAQILKGNSVSEEISFFINPGSRQALEHLASTGEYKYLIDAGVRVLENACGPCIGQGSAPSSGAVSLRSYNRNFEGRSGTEDAQVFLVSPETAAVSAINGKLTNPKSFGSPPEVSLPEKFDINMSMIVPPSGKKKSSEVELKRGKNIKPLPDFPALPEKLSEVVLLKVGDDVSTDHIIPAGAKLLPLRGNIPETSRYLFRDIDKNFYSKAREQDGGVIVGGANYGQGSSREHAAVAPKYLGISAVLAKSFSRIHRSNLINFGIVPLVGETEQLDEGDRIEIFLHDLNNDEISVENKSKELKIKFSLELSPRERSILKKGGLIPYVKAKN